MSKVEELTCIKFKRKAALKVYRKISRMTREEEIEYWTKLTEKEMKRADERRKKENTLKDKSG